MVMGPGPVAYPSYTGYVGYGGYGATLGTRYYCADYTLYNANPLRGDEDIRKEIELTLVWDTWVNYDEIEIEVSDGVATLGGEVDTVTAKRSAGDDAWDTVGVVDVVNNIRVRQVAPETQRAQAQPA
jgi:hypothetical protein